MDELTYSGITGIITAIVTWFLARKKYYSEVDNNYIENMQKSLQFYEQLADANKTRLESLIERNNKLENEVIELRKQIVKLTNDLNSLKERTLKEPDKSKLKDIKKKNL